MVQTTNHFVPHLIWPLKLIVGGPASYLGNLACLDVVLSVWGLLGYILAASWPTTDITGAKKINYNIII